MDRYFKTYKDSPSLIPDCEISVLQNL